MIKRSWYAIIAKLSVSTVYLHAKAALGLSCAAIVQIDLTNIFILISNLPRLSDRSLQTAIKSIAIAVVTKFKTAIQFAELVSSKILTFGYAISVLIKTTIAIPEIIFCRQLSISTPSKTENFKHILSSLMKIFKIFLSLRIDNN